ncbi:MAG: nickel pincer cofactor biosynthesis protein LarC, partial [Lachnospiraceae bacterium]|nr:nickel pincer cofactor biosynthesis protein LarC [Lachnospiraceae bacterium]
HVHEEHSHENHDHAHGEHAHHHTHTHHHSSLHDIEHIVRGHLALPEKVQDDIMAVYRLIAEAESHAHGVPVTEIHFHEVGTMDAVTDIAMVCMLMNRIAPDEVVVSPVHVGSGQVRCAHGILPVPAPATAFILKDVPVYGGNVRGELCTPTGAALLKYFATRFGSMPVMKMGAIGYGMGKKDFEAANCVRAILGETEDRTEQVLELSCNVDDMTAEQTGFAMECLFESGALDVYTVPVGMKKNRPGTLIRVVCRESDKEAMLALIFRHTTTLGVREARMQRYVLNRKVEELQTPYGIVHRKDSSGYGVKRSKYEYDDLAAIAKEKDMSLDGVRDMLDKHLRHE